MKLVSFEEVSKTFDGIRALDQVTFSIPKGECLGLLGENGAGKSTLMKILAGVWPYHSYEGTVEIEGHLCKFQRPFDAVSSGVSMIHQELSLFEELTVAENLLLTEKYPFDGQSFSKMFSFASWRHCYLQAQAILDGCGFSISARNRVRELSVAERQCVEIARAFHRKAKIIVLDEPTSALSEKEKSLLFSLIEKNRSHTTFVYISHRLDEIFAITNRIVVLRDGKFVIESPTKDATREKLVQWMVGRSVNFPKGKNGIGERESVFEVKDLTHVDATGHAVVRDVSFSVRRGEILGIAGLMGSGRSEVIRSCLGLLKGKRTGTMKLHEKSVQWKNIREAMNDRVAFVPEDRKKDGLFLKLPIESNLLISVLRRFQAFPFPWLRGAKLIEFAISSACAVQLRYTSMKTHVGRLSGGNQQKVMLARAMAVQPNVLFLDEPTRGIDVGAKSEIYELIRDLSKKGMAILMVSSELNEILHLSHRVLVMSEGRVAGCLENTNLTQETIMTLASGMNRPSAS